VGNPADQDRPASIEDVLEERLRLEDRLEVWDRLYAIAFTTLLARAEARIESIPRIAADLATDAEERRLEFIEVITKVKTP
jgi:hypothetical protein